MTRLERLAIVVGIVLAGIVPLLLLVTWGHVQTVTAHHLQVTTTTRAFKGSDLERRFRIELIALSGVVVAIGLVGLFRRLHPMALLLCFAAMAAEVVLIAVEWNNNSLFGINANPHVTVSWAWATTTVAAGLIASAIGAALWLGLLAAGLALGKQCPDCAERVGRSRIDCPHCGYRFPLRRGLKRCEQCQRPVKVEAHVCRYCGHRFDEAVRGGVGVDDD